MSDFLLLSHFLHHLFIHSGDPRRYEQARPGPGNRGSEDAGRREEDPLVIIRWRHQKAIALSSAAAARGLGGGAAIEDATASERASEGRRRRRIIMGRNHRLLTRRRSWGNILE